MNADTLNSLLKATGVPGIFSFHGTGEEDVVLEFLGSSRKMSDVEMVQKVIEAMATAKVAGIFAFRRLGAHLNLEYDRGNLYLRCGEILAVSWIIGSTPPEALAEGFTGSAAYEFNQRLRELDARDEGTLASWIEDVEAA